MSEKIEKGPEDGEAGQCRSAVEAAEQTLAEAQKELAAAEKEAEEARAAEKAVSEKIEKGPEDGEAGQRRSAVEAAEQTLADAQKELDTAQMANDEAQAQLQKALKEKEETLAAGEAGKAVEAASELRNEAKKALDTAAGQVKDSEDLAELNDEIKNLEEARKAAETEIEDIGKERLKEAEDNERSTKAEADEAKKDYDAAAGKWKEAAAKARNARDAADLAEQALSKAQAAHNMGSKQINPLQNSLTNMKLRKDTGKEAQESCGEQHDQCKEANIALQATSDDNLLEINTGYGKVKRLSKQTCYHEKRVREVCQHMEAARKLLSEVVEIPDITDTSDPSDTPEAGE